MTPTRIMKLPKHDKVLIGRDMAEIFEFNHVYEIKKYLGEIVVVDLGESALSEYEAKTMEIDDIMTGTEGRYLIAKKEIPGEDE